MSAHYTLLLRISLVPELAAANSAVLHFVLNGAAEQPDRFPDHAFFRSFVPADRFHRSYRDFPAGSWTAVFWQRHSANGACMAAGVQLCLPGNKLEAIFQELLLLMQWLASMSLDDGAVGMACADDLPVAEPTVFYVRQRRLFIANSDPRQAQAVDDGSSFFGEGRISAL